MSRSVKDTSTILDNAGKAQNKKIILACGVVIDGVGDFYHLLDLISVSDTFLINYQKDIFITTAHPAGQIQDFKTHLEKKGFITTIVTTAYDFEQALEAGKPTDRKAFILDLKAMYGEIKNDIILKVNKVYDGMVDISNQVFATENRIERFRIPRLWIAEHGNTNGFTEELTKRSMNLLSGTKSIFLSKENRDKPAKQLAEVLSKPSNSAVSAALLETEIKEQAELEKACDLFLKNNLFVPSYLQHNDAAIVNFINTAAESPLSVEFKSIVFFTNKVTSKVLEDAAKGFISKKVKEIIIKTKDGEKKIINTGADKDAKTVKMVSGYRITEDEDYRKLFHCAQYFGGCSGDKTFEMVLSNGLIPLFITHNISGKIGFIEDASKMDARFGFLKRLGTANDLLRSALLSQLRQLFLIQSQLSDLGLSEEDFPECIKKWKQALITGEPFVVEGELYSPQYTKTSKQSMVTIFIDELFKARNKKRDRAEYRRIEDQFIQLAENKQAPEALVKFLKELGVEGETDKELLELAMQIADALRHPRDITIDEMKFESELSEVQREALIKYFIENDYFKIVSVQLAKFADIGSSLDRDFFKHWQELCIDLYKDYNLHDKLPAIINEFFSDITPTLTAIDDIHRTRKKP